MAMNAEPLEILILLKNMTDGAFAKVKGNLTSLESKANSTNLSGFSRASKTMEKDATAAAGKEAKGGGGIGGMIGGLLGIPGPAGLAVVAIGALIGIGTEAAKTSEEVTKQENLLDLAYQAHGSTLDANRAALETLIGTGERYGQGADAVRAAVLELVQAGHSQADVMTSMGPILMLAQQKHMALADAAKAVELAEMGNAKVLKDLGIALPKVTNAQAALDKATQGVTKAHTGLTSAGNALKLMEDSLAGKHKLTAAEALRLKIAHEKVTTASDALRAAQDKLTAAQKANVSTGVRQNLVLDALHSKLGDAKSAATSEEVVTTKLSNSWQKFAMVVGPPVMGVFNWLLNALSDMITWLGDAAHWVQNLGASFGAALRPIKDVLGAIGGVMSFIGQTVGSGGGNILSGVLGALPHFAAGGVVPGATGAATLAVVHGGEHIYPVGQAGSVGGGGTSVVHVHLHLDSAEIAYKMERVLGASLALRGTSLGMGGV
jgi:hypothetical protein